jgi:hypothetical protein
MVHAAGGSGSASGRSLFYRLDFGARSWYTRRARASVKPLILLSLVKRRGNPSLSAILANSPYSSVLPRHRVKRSVFDAGATMPP